MDVSSLVIFFKIIQEYDLETNIPLVSIYILVHITEHSGTYGWEKLWECIPIAWIKKTMKCCSTKSSSQYEWLLSKFLGSHWFHQVLKISGPRATKRDVFHSSLWKSPVPMKIKSLATVCLFVCFYFWECCVSTINR